MRAGRTADQLQLVRVVPLEPEAVTAAGPFLCAPSRSGLTVRFIAWRRTAADTSLHPSV